MCCTRCPRLPLAGAARGGVLVLHWALTTGQCATYNQSRADGCLPSRRRGGHDVTSTTEPVRRTLSRELLACTSDHLHSKGAPLEK